MFFRLSMFRNDYKKPIYAIKDDSNSSDSGEKEEWCICRSTDGSRFMICCDNCEEWFHGDCVNVTPKQAENISKYFCPPCRTKNPQLKIEFKNAAIKPQKDKMDKPLGKIRFDEKNKIHGSKPVKEISISREEKNTKFGKDMNSHRDDKMIFPPKKDVKDIKSNKIGETCSSIKSEMKSNRIIEFGLLKVEKDNNNKPYKSTLPETSTPTFKLEKEVKSVNNNKMLDYSSIKAEKEVKLTKGLDILPKFHKSNKQPAIDTKTERDQSNRCGECLGCCRKVDCNTCLNCRTKTGFCLQRACSRNQPMKIEKQQSNNKPLSSSVVTDRPSLTKLPGDFLPQKSLSSSSKKVILPTKVSQTSYRNVGLPSSSSSLSGENQFPPIKQQKTLKKRKISPSLLSTSDTESSLDDRIVRKKSSVISMGLPPSKKPKMSVVESSELDEEEEDMSDESDDEEEDEDFNNEKSNAVDDDDESEEENEEESEESEEESQSSGDSNESYRPVKQKKMLQQKKKSIMSKRNSLKQARPRSSAITKIAVDNDSVTSSSLLARSTRMSTTLKPQTPIIQCKPKECQNCDCTNPSRLGSKYCSDECGIKLAEQRLLTFLPNRVNNWNNSVSISNNMDKQALSDIQDELETIIYNLRMLDSSHKDLTDFIERWRTNCIATSITDEDDRKGGNANDDSVQCVTCGVLVGSSKALAHMENCYQKIEGATMVFADFEEQPIGTKLFCDYYDHNINGYCKRLAALCDHNKEAKVDVKTICAFPLSVNERSDKVCMSSKIKCTRHVNWERIQRAVIDINRYRLLVRYEELQQEDRRLKHNMAQRGGVMSLLLHETIDHQPMNPIIAPKNKSNFMKMRKFTKALCI